MRLTLTTSVAFAFVSLAFAQDAVLSGPEMAQYAPHAVELGWKYFKEGNYDIALRRFEMAVGHDKDFAPGYYGIAYVYSVEGKLDDAIKFYRETLKRDPTHVYTYANLGYALLQKNQVPEALQMLDKALQMDPNCGEAHLSYANYYASKQDWKNAEKSINKAVRNGQEIHPDLRRLLEQHGVNIAD